MEPVPTTCKMFGLSYTQVRENKKKGKFVYGEQIETGLGFKTKTGIQSGAGCSVELDVLE